MMQQTLEKLTCLQDETLKHAPSVEHAFFTRNGGVSEGIYGSLNAGAGSNDNPAHVQENLRRIATNLDVEPSHLCTLYQIHSDKVVTVNTPWIQAERPQADGMVTATPGIALGILTADCAPVLFADGEARVIGACHAGWKGAFANIMERTVDAMEALGAKRKRIIAAVGPCIGQASYEVGKSFYDTFMEQSADNARYFISSAKKPEHYHFDLPRYVQMRLQACCIASANILAKDTCFHENTFFSFRRKTLRGEADYGRQLSAIALKPL